MIIEQPIDREKGEGERVKRTAVRHGLLLFVALRLFLSLWAVASLAINPLPAEPDEVVRPYLGEPPLQEGVTGLLLGPWQRFDTQHYLRIAREGYGAADSVFPPLYPLAIRTLGSLLGGGAVANLAAALLLSNLACLALFILLHWVVSAELDPATAARTLVYFALFPTSFFLFAAYTEPLFLLLALGSLWAARGGRFWLAGGLGFLAALTRLTGWALVVPLAYELWQQRSWRSGTGKRLVLESREAQESHPPAPLPAHPVTLSLPHLVILSPLLPPLALAAFLAWRWWAGLPPLSGVYEQYWFQVTGFPGVDLVTAVGTLFFGGAARNNEMISLAFDFTCALLLIITTIRALRRLPLTYGLYAAVLLLFILLPTSELKPLYSFSRYTLAFFPTFMLLGMAGKRPWINRLILYPSLALYLYFSSQFFIWGWVG